MNCSDVFPWQRRVVVAVAMSVGGCSSFNPYQRSHRVDVPVRQLAAEEKGKHSAIEALAGGLHGATGALKDQRKEWYDSLSSQARIRYATQFGLIGLTAVALYGGLKSGVASDNDKKRLALAGAAGFAAYSGSTWFVNAGQEHVYIEGIRELTCAMMNIEPLRMSDDDFGQMKHELKALNKAINHLDASTLKAEAQYRYPRDSESAGALVRSEAMLALKRARQTLTSSWQLHDQLNNSGVVLMREGDLVFARVASRINDAQKDIAPPDALAGQGVGIIKSFRSVKIDAAGESSQPSTAPLAPENASAAKKEAADTTKPLAAVQPANSSRTGMIESQGKSAKAVSTTTLEKASLEDLLTRAMVLQAAQAAAVEKAQKALKTAEEEAAKAKKKNDVGLPKPPSNEAEVATNLATQTAELYAARRSLSDRLLRFYEARRSVEKGNCVGAVSKMALAPSRDDKVNPGDVYEITVSGVPVPPQVTLSGPAASETVVGAAEQYRVRIQIAADAQGTVDVAISDRGLATEDIRLTVEAKPR